jgi:hypothetical protein
MTQYEHLALVRSKEGGQDGEECGLSGSVGAENTPERSLRNAEVHIPQGIFPPSSQKSRQKSLAKSFYLDRILHRLTIHGRSIRKGLALRYKANPRICATLWSGAPFVSLGNSPYAFHGMVFITSDPWCKETAFWSSDPPGLPHYAGTS